MFKNGAPRMSSRTTTVPPMITGRRITFIARSCQNPSPTRGFFFLRKIGTESTFGPRVARIAGSVTTAPITAMATTEIPAYANDRRKMSGKIKRAASEAATVKPLNMTVRPAVMRLLTTASSELAPSFISSRNLETTNSA